MVRAPLPHTPIEVAAGIFCGPTAAAALCHEEQGVVDTCVPEVAGYAVDSGMEVGVASKAAVSGELAVAGNGEQVVAREVEVSGELGVAAASSELGVVVSGQQGMALVEFHGGGDGGDGGGDHGACAPVSCCRPVARPAIAHGDDASHPCVHGGPSAAPQHREPELVLQPPGRRSKARRHRSRTKAPP